MKCKTCKNEIKSEEIRGTLGMKSVFCCGKVQVDIDSLRKKVKTLLRDNKSINTIEETTEV